MDGRRLRAVVGTACSAAMTGLGSGRAIGGSKDCTMSALAAYSLGLEVPSQVELRSRMAQLAHTAMAGWESECSWASPSVRV